VSKVKRWRASEVLAFLETKIKEDTATRKESELYENVRWFDEKLTSTNYVVKSLLKQMNKQYNG
jgi:hypothetical protein